MKKNLEKVFASASIVVAVVLIMILLVTAFGGIEFEEFQTKLVRGLLIALAVIYFVLSITSLALIFVNNDVVKEIIIRSEQNGSSRASIGVVRKLVKNTTNEIDGVKCQKVSLVSNEYGVRLKVDVKVVDKDVVEVETYVRTSLEDAFKGVFGFKFHSIEIKVTSLKPNYTVNKAAVKEKADKIIAEKKVEESVATVELTEEENDAVVPQVENVEETVEVKAEENIDVKEGEFEKVSEDVDPLFSQDVDEKDEKEEAPVDSKENKEDIIVK